jgi:ribulose-5-phosphate 4-epimerase/fuculose-1-phosphate aldolase
MENEGVIKFNSDWVKTKPVEFELSGPLNYWRNYLYELGLIGVNEQGIGFGNISSRYKINKFIISGSGTGNIKTLSMDHYSLVTSYNIETNTLHAEGPVAASSESLTHAALYESDLSINSVIHIHNRVLWENYINVLPTSDHTVEYGTPAMAKEVKRLFLNTDLPDVKILIMGGHPDGIITFGNTMDEAASILLDLLRK